MKVKSNLALTQDKQFQHNLAYEEWLKEFASGVSQTDINKMEKDHLSKQPSNNPNYHSLPSGA